MKILVLGSGGREHALAHTFARQGHRVWCFPGNAGTDSQCEPWLIDKPDSLDNHAALIDVAQKLQIDLTVVGPEQPLSQGIADAFAKAGLKLFGPTAKAARIESEKSWSKKFMERYGIPTAPFTICRSPTDAREAIEQYFNEWKGLVVKPSGLTSGKGVIACKTPDEARNAVKIIMEDRRYGPAGSELVLEKILYGKELSLLAFCDGKKIVPMLTSQDHKKLGEGDEGPNTGGIGAYAPTNFVTPALRHEMENIIIARTAAGLVQEGIDYRGVIYIGLMITDQGAKVLEYNCRFGDPEAQVILPLLKSDLATIMLACVDGKLKPEMVQWHPKSACCVVMVAEGYPFNFPTGDVINGLDQTEEDICVYQAGTKRNTQGQVVTTSGRVLGVTGIGDTMENAIAKAYKGTSKIDFVSAYYRRDIAYQAK